MSCFYHYCCLQLILLFGDDSLEGAGRCTPTGNKLWDKYFVINILG